MIEFMIIIKWNPEPFHTLGLKVKRSKIKTDDVHREFITKLCD